MKTIIKNYLITSEKDFKPDKVKITVILNLIGKELEKR